jgi:hypothetical protein
MEVSAKEVGGEGGQQDEGGRWVGVGRSFPKNNFGGQGWAQKKSDKKKTVPRRKNIDILTKKSDPWGTVSSHG